MQFTATSLAGAMIVDLDPISDSRGFFARAFCRQEFKSEGLTAEVVQANLSFNVHKGTVRGMHFQIQPALETKFIRCIRGSIIDVIVDLRPDSSTYLKHICVELNSENRRALYVPANFAHGFQTLENNTEVMYLVSGFYSPEFERGLRYCDPALSIHWPLPVQEISEKDKQWPFLREPL